MRQTLPGSRARPVPRGPSERLKIDSFGEFELVAFNSDKD